MVSSLYCLYVCSVIVTFMCIKKNTPERFADACNRGPSQHMQLFNLCLKNRFVTASTMAIKQKVESFSEVDSVQVEMRANL